MGNMAFDFENAGTGAMVTRLRDCDQDHEFYPTTEAMLDDIRADMREFFNIRDEMDIHESVLDCGAGDGRALMSLTKGDRYAIERARPLLDSLDRSIFCVGVEFHANTLIDKKVDMVFCNPPYSEYQEWTLKVIKEANARVLYLVIPSRWESDQRIQDAIAARRGLVSVVSETDFEDGQRRARAKVQILRIDLSQGRWSRDGGAVDPFDLWFEENFPLNVSDRSTSDFDIEQGERRKAKENIESQGELVSRRGLVAVLEEFYQKELDKLMTNYQRLCELDHDLLRELDVNLQGVKSALKMKIQSLKSAYWQKLFENLNTITDRLTSQSRKRMLDTLMRHMHVDFNSSNCHCVVMWAVKNANAYLDQQLIDVVEKMVDRANVRLYKSNARTFGEELWRYGRKPQGLDRYQLEYRVVMHNVGGICTSEWSYERTQSGIEKRAETFLDDLRTVANNIGFSTYGLPGATRAHFESGKKVLFSFDDHRAGELDVLMEVKAYKNKNLHVKAHERFMQRLNIEFGRLRGWVKSAREAAHEMDVAEAEAQAAFGANYQITKAALPMLIGPDNGAEAEECHDDSNQSR